MPMEKSHYSNKPHTTLTTFIQKLNLQMNDLTIQVFHFNPLVVNTLLLHDTQGEAIIVDPGNCCTREDVQLQDYISRHGLTIKAIVNTHPHIDHIAGNRWCAETFKAPILCHAAGMSIYQKASAYGAAFCIPGEDMPKPDKFVHEGDYISFGNQKLLVLYTPGHCDGSISLYDATHQFVICGDVIFEGSVGCTNLPTGNAHLLIQMIQEKILSLPDEVTIFSGHGNNTSVGYERINNPYLL